MSEIQRFQWTELTKDGIGLPDDVVLYSDHAAEVSALREELEQTRVQLAGCGSAALGYADDCKRGEYGYSASLGDVLTLRRETVSLRAQLEAAEKRLDQREQVLGMYIDKLHEAHKRINALSKPASCRFCGGDTHAQLTAQPDGVREAADALLQACERSQHGSGVTEIIGIAMVKYRAAVAKALRATTPAASTPPEGKVRLDVCVCGHLKRDHVYHEGACRPGFRCEHGCVEFSVAPQALAAPAPSAEVK